MTEIIDKYYDNRKEHADEIFVHLEKEMGEVLFKAYLGDAASQYKIGDDTKDIKWLEKAAAQGYKRAQNTLGTWYHNASNGICRNYEKAKEWYFKAIEGDKPYATAYNNIGKLYENGTGFDKDIYMAIENYEKAIELGCSHADRNLGKIYFYGNDEIENDYEKAFQLLTKATEAGDAEAPYYLSIMYAKGYHVEKDIKKSLENLMISKERDHPKAQEKLDKFYNEF